MDSTRRRWIFLTAVWIAGMFLVTAAAQSPESPTLEQQLEKLTQMQSLMEKELQVIQRQLEDIRTVLQNRPSQPPVPAAVQPSELTLDGATLKGTHNAKVTIVEFSDFQCPFCGRYARETYDQLEREYIDTGKVRYAFRHFPLEKIHPEAFAAAEAVACAEMQGQFWEMRSRLFANQAGLMRDDLAKYGQEIGLDQTKFRTCMAGDMTARVRQDITLGARAGVSVTPTFFFGTAIHDTGDKIRIIRKTSGALPYTNFKAIIDSLLASTQTSDTSTSGR
jgi:protein-disulfide isomerase